MNFTDKRLLKLLIKKGKSEEEAKAFIDELNAEKDDEEVKETETEEKVDEVEVDGEPTEKVEEETKTDGVEEVKEEKSTPVEENETPAETEKPVEDDKKVEEEAKTEEVVESTEETKVAEEEKEEAWKVPYDELRAENLELKKANEGLAARLESLEDSLAKAGVLRIPTQEVGVDKPSVVASENPSGNLSELLRVMNGH